MKTIGMTHFPGSVLALLTLSLSSVYGASFFTEPEAPFVTGPGEKIEIVPLPAGDEATAQASIDSARSNNPHSVLLLKPRGTVEIGDRPLVLGSDMCLQLSPEAGIVASANCHASCLISITNARNVTISSMGPEAARIDGAKKPVVGINVVAGGRMNFDHLMISGCGISALDFAGNDAGAYDEAASVSRCRIENNGSGVKSDHTAAFVCIDNSFLANGKTALDITSPNSVVAGNAFDGNGTAISSGSSHGVITRNLLGSNRIAIELTSPSSENMVSENRATSSNIAVTVSGSGNTFFRNRLPGTVTSSGGSNNLLVANDALFVAPDVTGVATFNPPTFDNPHSNPVILPGMGRTDLTMTGGIRPRKTPEEKRDAAGKIIPMPEGIDTRELPMDISVVQEAVGKARLSNPTNVVVLHLEGDFISRTTNGLMLPENTCVILSGRILTDLGIPSDPPWVKGAPETQVVLMAAKGYSSFSGGKLDGGRHARFGINAGKQAPSIALVEGVTVQATAHDGIYIKGRSSPGPLFLYRNHILGCGGRGIWPHVSTPVHLIANVCSGNRMDGIDFDAHGHNNTALFNISSGNGRHGLFLEEAVHNNLAFGNILSGNGGSGIHVWNQEVTGNTGSNTLVANRCEGNRKGVSVGGHAEDRTASGNLFFNNVCEDNRIDGISSGQSRATKNFFSQCVTRLNRGEQIRDSDSAKAYFLNTVDPKSHP